MPEPVDAEVVSQFERQVAPTLRENGIRVEGVFVTEPAENTFTRLPVREGEHVLAWFGTVDGHPPGRLEELAGKIALGDAPVSLLDLEPTSRSALGNGPRAARASKHDFDFLLGSWTVRNRYLVGRFRARRSGSSSTPAARPARSSTVSRTWTAARSRGTARGSRASRCDCSTRRPARGRSTGPTARIRGRCFRP